MQTEIIIAIAFTIYWIIGAITTLKIGALPMNESFIFVWIAQSFIWPVCGLIWLGFYVYDKIKGEEKLRIIQRKDLKVGDTVLFNRPNKKLNEEK